MLPSAISGQELVLIGVIAVLWVILAFATPAFFTAGSIQPLLVAMAPIALVGVGMTIIIITGGIDVSVGAAIMVCAVITAKLLVDQGLALPLAVLVSVLVGGVLGLVNGLLIAYGRVHAIIITFGTANIFLFLGLQIFGSSTVNNIPQTFDVFGRGVAGRTFGIPHAFLITVIIAAIAWWYLRHTAGGRHFYAIGGDAHAARLAGVRVQRRILLAYLITGLLVGPRVLLRHRAGHLDPGPECRHRQGTRGDRGRGDRRHLDHGWPRFGARHPAGRAAGADRHLRRHPARLELAAVRPVRRHLHHRRGRRRPDPRAGKESEMSAPVIDPATAPAPKSGPAAESRGQPGGSGAAHPADRAVGRADRGRGRSCSSSWTRTAT